MKSALSNDPHAEMRSTESSGEGVPAVGLHNFVSELLEDLLTAFSDDKTIREIACDICKIVLTGINKRFYNNQIDICALFGFFDGLNVLRLRGAAGFQPYGMRWKNIKVGEGIIGQVAQNKKPIIIDDLRNDPQINTVVELTLAQLADSVALLAYPSLLPNGQLDSVLVLGKFNLGSTSNNVLGHPGFHEMLDKLAKHIATIRHHERLIHHGKLAKEYSDNERHIRRSIEQFFGKLTREIDPKKFMERIALECLALLNAGNSAQPFYKNYLFYEYHEYSKRFVLSSFIKKPKYLVKSFSLHHRLYKEYVQDGFVKSIESQKKFVQNRGKEPYIIRYIPNKLQEVEKNKRIEEIIEKLDADWSPAGLGSAFIVPLSEGKRPLGILVFLSRHQNRQYVNQPMFYLGREKRKASRSDLKYFRSLQPFVASEYFKLQLKDKQRIVVKLENIMNALKEIILIENRSEVLDRLAEFTAKSLDCEGCLIYLLKPTRSHLYVAATSGFRTNGSLKEDMKFPLNPSSAQRKELPVQIFENKNEMIANSGREFRRFFGNRNRLSPYFRQLKSRRVISYLGRPIGNLGVIEVFNKSKITPSGWSFFEEQDATTLRHIGDVIATVLKRMEATASHVQSEKVKVTSELLLDISHELKNPLYSSLIFLRKLKTSLNGHLTLEDGNLQTLDIIERNVEKAQRILRGMQDFQASMRHTNWEPVNLETILRMVLETNRSFCDQQRITIGSEFSVAEPLVYGDELQLNQLFTNLVKNAIDAMTTGGMLTVRLYEMDGSLQAEIADTGDGIPDDIKDRIFEPFVTTKNPDSGTGLGLVLCKRIINQHQGKIEFETELGWGTKFIVTLPRLVEPTFTPVKQLTAPPATE